MSALFLWRIASSPKTARSGYFWRHQSTLSSPASEMWKYANRGENSVNGEALRRGWSPAGEKPSLVRTTWRGHGPLCVKGTAGPPAAHRLVPVCRTVAFLRSDQNTRTWTRSIAAAWRFTSAYCGVVLEQIFSLLRCECRIHLAIPLQHFFISRVDLRSFNIFCVNLGAMLRSHATPF